MRNFDWIFNAEGKVAENKECVFDRECHLYDEYDFPEPQVVTLAGYRPYYTDGTPDPKNDEVDTDCMIELNEYPDGDCQVLLRDLYEITETDIKDVLYNGYVYKVHGEFVGKYGDEQYVLEKIREDGYLIVEKDSKYIEDRYDIHDLNREQAEQLFDEVCRGSMCSSDYHNNVGIPCEEAQDCFDDYYSWLHDEYGEDYKYDSVENFLQYLGF